MNSLSLEALWLANTKHFLVYHGKGVQDINWEFHKNWAWISAEKSQLIIVFVFLYVFIN